MAISKMVARVSALLTYSGGATKQVLASVDDKGNEAVNVSSGHEEVMIEAETSLATWTDFVTLTVAAEALSAGSTVALAPTLSVAATPETVVSMVVTISGTIANTDNTSASFIYKYEDGTWTVPVKEDTALVSTNTEVVAALDTWVAILGDATQLATLTSLFATAGLTLS